MPVRLENVAEPADVALCKPNVRTACRDAIDQGRLSRSETGSGDLALRAWLIVS
jgi:hypothetical protein